MMLNHWYFFLRDFFPCTDRGSEQVKARLQWSQDLGANHPWFQNVAPSTPFMSHWHTLNFGRDNHSSKLRHLHSTCCQLSVLYVCFSEQPTRSVPL